MDGSYQNRKIHCRQAKVPGDDTKATGRKIRDE